MFCPRFSCISASLKNRRNDLLLCPAASVARDPVASSSRRKAPLPLSAPPAVTTPITKLDLCISVLLCDLKKPSLVKHSQTSAAQPPPGTTPQLSCHLQASPSPPTAPHNSPEPHQAQTLTPSGDPLHGNRTQGRLRILTDTCCEQAKRLLRKKKKCLTFRFKYIVLHPLQMLLRHFGDGYLKIS